MRYTKAAQQHIPFKRISDVEICLLRHTSHRYNRAVEGRIEVMLTIIHVDIHVCYNNETPTTQEQYI